MVLPRLPAPVQRFLVPDERPVRPDGFTLVDEAISGGLPHTIRLDAETVLVVLAPTGTATLWRDAEPTAVVSTSETELEPYAGPPASPAGEVRRMPVRLLVRRARQTDAAIPLTLGRTSKATDSGDTARGVRLEIAVLAWEVRAGSLRGAGDYGSRITLAWRRADIAVEQYGPLPVNPHVIRRTLILPRTLDLPPRIVDLYRPLESALSRVAITEVKPFTIRRASFRVELP